MLTLFWFKIFAVDAVCPSASNIKFVLIRVGCPKLWLVVSRCLRNGRKQEEGEMNLRLMFIKNFMTSLQTLFPEQLSGAVSKKANVFLCYKNSKWNCTLKLQEVSTFQALGELWELFSWFLRPNLLCSYTQVLAYQAKQRKVETRVRSSQINSNADWEKCQIKRRFKKFT